LTDDNSLQDQLGKRLGPYNSFNPVSAVQVWQWCSAMGDRSPLYLDETYQSSTEFAGRRIVAPPAMMQMWTMRDINGAYAPGSTATKPYLIMDVLRQLGYSDNLAVSYDITFHRYLVEGDRAHHYQTVVNISELKTTALGEGYFFTDQMEFIDQHGELFAEAQVCYFQYRATGAETVPTGKKTQLPSHSGWQSDYTDLDSQMLREGMELPKLAIPITHELIIGGAIATQDFVKVHHNVNEAKAAGMPDIFMNILTTCGLSARYLAGWAGPGSRLKKLKFNLMGPNTPGDTMVMQGRLDSITSEQDVATVQVDFSGINQRGPHHMGSATLLLAR
jgi:hypothetical protein